MLGELESRFVVEASVVMKGIQSLSPHSKTFLDLETLQEMATKYDIHLSAEDLVYEVPQAKCLLNRKAEEGVVVETLQQLAEFLEPYKVQRRISLLVSPNNHSIVLPVSTASCQRSFSTMRQIKTYLRNSRTDGILFNLAVLSTEMKLAKALDLDNAVDD